LTISFSKPYIHPKYGIENLNPNKEQEINVLPEVRKI
jgi:hypothetical protein